MGREWLAKHSPNWTTAHANRFAANWNEMSFPGSEPVAELTAPDLLAVVRRIEERGTLKMSHDTLQICGRVWRYAVATGRLSETHLGTCAARCRPPRASICPPLPIRSRSAPCCACWAAIGERCRMMQIWADYLDRLKAGAESEATASKSPEAVAFPVHDGRIP